VLKKGRKRVEKGPEMGSGRTGKRLNCSCFYVNNDKVLWVSVVVFSRAKQVKTRRPKPPE